MPLSIPRAPAAATSPRWRARSPRAAPPWCNSATSNAGPGSVHVGWDDMDATQARRLLGPQAIIGLSIKNRAQIEAAPLGALDYVCVGGVFAPPSKDNPDPPIGVAGFKQLAADLRVHAKNKNLPVGAIAGIDATNAAEVI